MKSYLQVSTAARMMMLSSGGPAQLSKETDLSLSGALDF